MSTGIDASLKISRKACICAILCVVSIIAAQRFLLPSVAPLICMATLCFSFYEYNNRKHFNTILFITLFISTDISLPDYPGTPSILRYVIYFCIFLAMFRTNKISTKNATIGIFIIICYIILTLCIDLERNLTQLNRDFLILFLFFVSFLFHSPKFELDFDIISLSIIAFVASELINYFFLKMYWVGDYMSYDTTKFLVTLPTFYLIQKNYIYSAFIVIIATELVLLGYSSRNIFLLYNILLIYCFMSKLSILNCLALILIITLVTFLSMPIIVNYLDQEAANLLKPMRMIKTLVENDLSLVFKLLDPVRFYESVLFFEQNILRIAFGSGFGAGLVDTKDYLSFVTYTDTAFSRNELQNNTYYNFHDVWVDIGVRFGLVSLLILLVWIIVEGIKTDSSFLVATCYMSVFTGFFSVSGLLIAAIAILHLSSRRYV